MKVWNSASFFFIFYFLCGTVSVWEFDWLTLTFFFFFPVFVFLNLAVLCSLHLTRSHTCTHNNIYIYIYFFVGSCCTTTTMFVLCVLCCVFVGCVLCVHILPKFQFWNWNLEKNNLKFFWKSYNINNIGFFFCFFLKDFTIQLLLINIILIAVH